MLDALRRELAEPLPHPDAAALREFSAEAMDWVWRHYTSLREQQTGQTASRAEMEKLLREPPPESGRDFADVLADFQDKVAAKAFRPNHPRFFAFIPSAPTYLSILGELLCAGTNFFQGVWLEAPGPSAVELLVLDWFKEFLGYPQEARGLLTSGGSEANLTALVVAREPLSLADRERAVLYVTQQRHWSVDRSAKVMGLRREQIQPVPTDERFRMTAAALAEAVKRDRAAGRLPWALVANAGATNTGAVDPLAEVADCCAADRLWFHVDAAYGWSAALTTQGKELLNGIDRADSITLDPHKWFAQTFDAGCVLVREGHRLPQTFLVRADYMQDVEPASDEIN